MVVALATFTFFIAPKMVAATDLDPKAGVFFRVFKQAKGADPDYSEPGSYIEEDGVMSNWNQAVVEAWVYSPTQGRYELYKKFPVSAYRGLIGPKTHQGDHQTPEGFYSISRLNPHSKYGGKGLWLNYPNEHDLNQISNRKTGWTGGDIEIHGDHRSDGCLAMENQIHEIYEIANKALQGGQGEIPIQIFPFEMTNENLEKVRGNKWYHFWKNLKKGYDAFESTHIPPRVGVDRLTKDYVINSDVPHTEDQHTEIPHVEVIRTVEPEIKIKNQSSTVCIDALQAYFGKEANRDKVRKYLRIQGELTLHRLAWSYLKSQKTKTETLEHAIERLLKERDPQLHEKFLGKNPIHIEFKGYAHTTTLLEGFDALQEDVERTVGTDERNRPYQLKYGDRKMLGLLLSAQSVYGTGAKNGVIDFMNMINSSYRRSLGDRDTHLRVAEKMIRKSSAEMEKIAQEIEQFLIANGCSQPMATFSCADESNKTSSLERFGEMLQQSVEIQEALSSTLAQKKQDLLEANRWGSYWLHVGAATGRTP